LFLDLVRQADVLLSNFKPGTLDALGLGAAILSAANPRLVMADSSAFGPTGPWAKRLGYGPLVRAATGLSGMWRYADDPDSYSDAVTVYPDHVAGRISALGATALLIRRLRTGQGGTASVSQAEVMLGQFAASLTPGETLQTAGRDIVVRALGDDEWCVLTLPDGPAPRLDALLDGASIEEWMAMRSPMDAARSLQAIGIAAAPMLRVADLPDFAYCRERASFRVDRHPHLPEPVTSERTVARYRSLATPCANPAPLAGEHTREVIDTWIRLNSDQADSLEESGILQPTSPAIHSAIRTFLETEGAGADRAPG
jgi:crotonobetainyl-CoA:carnitine CoA-transferase CaiB-like acyl-CoA transferase